MKGQECKFVKYMEGSGKRFVIPVYQRNYDWKTENCKQLYDDLVKVVKEGRKSHFFGSIVSVFNPDSHGEEYLIIDGQQRLTTVTLLLLAMFNLLNSGVISSSKSNRKQFLYEEYLVDKWNDEVTLKPVKNDQIALGKLFSDKDEHIKSSNMTANYDYFYERIQRQEITVDELYEAICSLEIISILLNHEDDPQLIFESLNSKGMALSTADRIRNFNCRRSAYQRRICHFRHFSRQNSFFRISGRRTSCHQRLFRPDRTFCPTLPQSLCRLVEFR